MRSQATINIGGAERPLSEASPNWIKEQLGSRKDAGNSVCVRVAIHDTDVNVGLGTPSCPAGGGGGRPPNARERKILELWERHKLNTNEFNVGQLIAFIAEVIHL
jgi:hypothetical protein